MYDGMAIWGVECKFVVDSNFYLKHEGVSVGRIRLLHLEVFLSETSKKKTLLTGACRGRKVNQVTMSYFVFLSLFF